ncbi:hypothetical protein NEOLEDRAFT_1127967 [Neolentinus lepideus HHB14362 ss-1]|uniref:Uncharacterized protein n=1 Tax=Neolentinus lepideus HHB14362 ss-1 TaxID=1314782 RepID=A0A165V7N4_9AGAM|nr:hypothetical protein NEOLEDRAFT_1127967 [Neolentinus lepideus HHB14362 ss-1]
MSLYSHMQYSPSRQRKRPGPLNEWPLEEFFDEIRLAGSPFKSPNKKRPASPAATSPHKRRLLMSPDKLPSLTAELTKGRYAGMMEEPTKAQAAMFALSAMGAAEGGRFSDTDIHATPKRHPKSSTPLLLPSPELDSTAKTKHTPSRHHANDSDFDDDDNDAILDFSSSVRRPSPMLAPRELPPSPDRTSEHYPGFDIFRDPYIYVPHVSDRAPSPPPDEDDGKENKPPVEMIIPLPQSKMKKAATVPGSPLKQSITVMSPGAKKRMMEAGRKYQSMPVSPMKALHMESTAKDFQVDSGTNDATPIARRGRRSASPMRLGAGLDVPMRATPVRTPKEKKTARRMMEEEGDQPEGGDDELFM